MKMAFNAWYNQIPLLEGIVGLFTHSYIDHDSGQSLRQFELFLRMKGWSFASWLKYLIC